MEWAIRLTGTIGQRTLALKLSSRLVRWFGQGWVPYLGIILGRCFPMGLVRFLNTCGPMAVIAVFPVLHAFCSGIFSQSNYGIVTKMGFGLMPDPGGHESFVGYPMTVSQVVY